MIYKKVKYKGVSLYDSQYADPITPSYLVLQDMDMSVNYDTKSENISVYHGERWYLTTASGRRWKISWVIAEVDPAKRQTAIDYLKSIIRPEGILSNTPNYRIEWQDFQSRTFWAMARVSSEVSFSHSIQSPIVQFSFELWSESPQYFGNTLHSSTITPVIPSFGLFSWDDDWVHLWYVPEWGNISGGFSLVNAGNFEAWVLISDVSNGNWVFYINNTNSLRYGVTGVSMARIIDTRVRPTLVTDYGVDTSKNRMKGSTGFLLSPWENNVSANVAFYDFWAPPLDNSITLSWYDTYI